MASIPYWEPTDNRRQNTKLRRNGELAPCGLCTLDSVGDSRSLLQALLRFSHFLQKNALMVHPIHDRFLRHSLQRITGVLISP